MQDLNETMFYKAKFTIKSQNESVDLLWQLIMELRNWLIHKHNKGGQIVVNSDLKKWTRFKMGGKLFDEKNSNLFFAKSLYYVNRENPFHVYWACRIVENPLPREGVAPRKWTTEIGYQSENPGVAEISYVVTYSDLAGFIGEIEEAPSVSLPRVIRHLINDSKYICSVGSTQLRTRPLKLNPGDFPDFEKLIFSEDRALPVVYISPKRVDFTSDETKLLVSPEEMSVSIAANGLVFYSDSLDFSHEMKYLGDARYTCTGGAIRLYLPKVNKSKTDDRFRHRIISQEFITSHGESFVLEMFRRALAQDVHFYESMFRLDSCQALIDKDERQARIEAIKRRSEGAVDEAYTEYLAESDLRKQAEQELEQQKDEISRLKGDIYNLNVQVESLQDKARDIDAVKSASEQIRSFSEYPSTPTQIAHFFETVFRDRIAFTERAYKSLEECITKNDLLWDAFYSMATKLYDFFQCNPAQAFKSFTEATGWDCSRGNGHQTRANSKLMRQYVDTYNGQEIDIEAHVKTGNNDKDPRSVRIYFAYDPQVANKIIIGHCGKHLENATSRKIK